MISLGADSDFFDSKFLRKAEKRGIKYAIAAKLYSTIHAMWGGVSYRNIGEWD